MNKFIKALARHELARQKVDALSQRIGAAINRCPIEKKSLDYSLREPEYSMVFDKASGRVKNHLWMVYNAKAVYGEHFDETGQEEALRPENDGCRHCLRAFRLIRQRKQERAELGHAKLALRSLGKVALKLLDEDQ